MNLLRDSSLGSSLGSSLTHRIPSSGDGEAYKVICVCGGKKKRGYCSGYRDEEREGERVLDQKKTGTEPD